MKCTTDFEYKQVNTKEIITDAKGQRNVESRQAQFHKIMKTFNPRLVNPIKVGFVDGKYYCFDGQMTMKVLKARNGGHDLLVPCKVHYGLTLAEIADLFIAQNGTQSAVVQQDKLRVMFNYGDPDVTSFVRLTELNGIRIDWTAGYAKNKVVAVTAMYEVYKSFKNPCAYSEFCEILRTSWDGEPASFKREIINGLSIFMKAYGDKAPKQQIIKALRNVSPQKIIRDGKASNATGYRKYAIQIFNAYNSRRSTGRLPELF